MSITPTGDNAGDVAPKFTIRTVPRRIGSALVSAARSVRRALGRVDRWLGDLRLPAAATLSAAGLVGVALFVLWLAGRPKGGAFWNWYIEEMAWKDRLTYAAAVATGVGALVALVVAYRKQRDAEEGKFAAQFAAAAAQLGNDAPAVRIAGAYAISALADRHRDRRQQCIDVLTGYLRLPYEPGDGHRTSHTLERTIEVGGEPATSTDTSTYRPADREVRLTIIRIICDHLQDPASSTTWCGRDLDFTGATFDGGNFTGAKFGDGRVSFDEAKFSDGRVSLRRCDTRQQGLVPQCDVQQREGLLRPGDVQRPEGLLRPDEVEHRGCLLRRGEVQRRCLRRLGDVQWRGGLLRRGDVQWRGGLLRRGDVQRREGHLRLSDVQRRAGHQLWETVLGVEGWAVRGAAGSMSSVPDAGDVQAGHDAATGMPDAPLGPRAWA